MTEIHHANVDHDFSPESWQSLNAEMKKHMKPTRSDYVQAAAALSKAEDVGPLTADQLEGLFTGLKVPADYHRPLLEKK